VKARLTIDLSDTGLSLVDGIQVDDWQTVTVGGHTVTVKFSEDVADAGIADNLIVQCKSDGDLVIIESYSKNEFKPLVVRINNGSLIAPTENGSVSTFAISDIKEDITATLAYAKQRTVSFNKKVDKEPNVKNYEYGKVEPIKVIEGRPSTLTATPGEGYAFDYFNVKGTRYGDKAEVLIPSDVETIDAYFRFTDYPLPGVFTVADDKAGNVRKVQFARGNLWYQNGVFHNENEQYAFSSSDWKEGGHISHFMWCKSAEESVKLRYAEQGVTYSDNLFTNASATSPSLDFAANGQKGLWRTLSGGDNGEWEYLIDRKDGTLYKYGVKVCGSANCLILLPDDWKWGENGVGSGWLSEYSESTTVKWSTMEAAGAVCLPAAGYRNGYDGTDVRNVGDLGYYWSSTPNYHDRAYYLRFTSGNVYPADNYVRYYAFAVRLVTDVK
ncbi:MAG: DUF1566 domain-containing protein, partial [Bacteroidales bacterium]|nr:DUF1566 domain-containing protein [Bacteroidales bacterium]